MTNGLLQEVRECIAWEELARPVKFSLAGNAEAIATATEKGGALRSLLPAAAFVRGGNLAVARILAALAFALEKTFTLTSHESSLATEAQHTGRRWNLLRL